jgi:hypothetical protein
LAPGGETGKEEKFSIAKMKSTSRVCPVAQGFSEKLVAYLLCGNIFPKQTNNVEP